MKNQHRHSLTRRLTFICASILIAAAGCQFSVLAASNDLSGKMLLFRPLIGGMWACRSQSSGPSGKQTGQDSATFEVSRNNTVHEHTLGSDAQGDDYYGYNEASNAYWHLSVNSRAAYAFAVSPDAKTYVGYYWSALTGKRERTVTTYNRLSDQEISGTLTIGDAPSENVIVVQCTRSR